VFLFTEVGALHGRARGIEIANGLVGKEVVGLDKAEVHRTDAIVVEHDDIGVGVQSFPAVGRFVSTMLTIMIGFIKRVRPYYLLSRGMFGRSTFLMTDIEKMIGVVNLDDVRIYDVVGLVGSFHQKTRLFDKGVVIVVYISIIYFIK